MARRDAGAGGRSNAGVKELAQQDNTEDDDHLERVSTHKITMQRQGPAGTFARHSTVLGSGRALSPAVSPAVARSGGTGVRVGQGARARLCVWGALGVCWQRWGGKQPGKRPKLSLGGADNPESSETSRARSLARARESKRAQALRRMREAADATLKRLDTHQPEPRPTIASPRTPEDITVLQVWSLQVGTSGKVPETVDDPHQAADPF